MANSWLIRDNLCFERACSCESRFPFGRSVPRVNVKVMGFGKACCFR